MMAQWGWDIKVRTCKCREWVPGRWAVVTGDWRLETGGGESWVSDNTHGDISETEKMLVHVMWLEREKRKMTMDAFIQWWFKSDQYQSKVSKIGFQSWGLTKRLIKPLDFETNNQSKVNPSYFLISFISDCIIQYTMREGRGMREVMTVSRWDRQGRGGESVITNTHCCVYSWWSFRKLLTRIFLSCGSFWPYVQCAFRCDLSVTILG